MVARKVMTIRKSVVVKALPESLSLGKAREFLERILPCLKSDRPSLVFDLSGVRHLDSTGVETLMECLEQVIKRNGDIKLAAVPPGPAVILELTRVDRLFEIYDDVSDAVESFYRFPVEAFRKLEERESSTSFGAREAA